MSEKNKQNVTEKQVILDPFDQVYPEDAMVEVPASWFARALQISGSIAREEMKESITVNQFDFEDGPLRDDKGNMKPFRKIVTVSTTPRGVACEELFNDGMQIHIENAQNGLTFSASEAEKSEVALDL